MLFLSFRALVEDLDKENSDLVSGPLVGSTQHHGLRHRTTTATETTTDQEGKGKGKIPAQSKGGVGVGEDGDGDGDGDGGERKERKERKMISEELRELLVSWKPEH